jgi:hemolysin III
VSVNEGARKHRPQQVHVDSLNNPADSHYYSGSSQGHNLFIQDFSKHLMPNNPKPNKYSIREELAHGISHAIGAGLAIIGLVILLITATQYGDVRHVVSAAIYGSSLILLYLASTLYHLFASPRVKRFFQKLDHTMIYILIAGTYTPLTLVTLRGAWGWTLFGLVWAMALCGLVLELIVKKRIEWLSLTLYLGMGWLLLVALKPLTGALATGGFVLVLAGGLLYSFGVIFYVWKNLSYNHAIWHLFVMAGSMVHFFAILFYVMPAAA